MRGLGTSVRWLGLALVLFFLVGWLPASLGAYGLFWQRYASSFLANPFDPAYDWFEPLETVAGRFAGPIAGPVAGPVAAAGSSAFREGALEEVAQYARARNSDSLIVLHRGRLVFERYWNTKKAESLVNAQELTNTLSAILVGHAIADGAISSVDQPAYHFLAEWDDPAHRPITIRHLLNMAGGIRDGRGFAPWSPRVQARMGTDIVPPTLAAPIAGPPGVKFAHADASARLLGIILERATGRRYGEYLAEKLWKPIGARDAQLFLDRPGGTAHTDCCLWAAIEDWARVGELLRTGGRWNDAQVIPAGWVEDMIAPSAAYLNYGMMVWLGNFHENNRRHADDVDARSSRHSEPFAAPTFFLDGLNRQRVWVVPSKELVIVRTGRDHPDWDDAELPNLVIRGLAP